VSGAFALRVARPDDAAAVSAVLAASYSMFYCGWYRDDVLARALPAMTRANPVLLASGRYFVAEKGGAITACGGWSEGGPGGVTPGVPQLRHFATHPDFVNQGAGGAIVARCFEEARAAGFADMEVISSLPAEAFYAGRGFAHVAVITQPIGGAAFACILMRRSLALGA
jgi:N-acetylglutamate synthase-like GNAT family acetyltransferase